MGELIKIYLLVVEGAIKCFYLLRVVLNFRIWIELPGLLSGVVFAPETFPSFGSWLRFFHGCLLLFTSWNRRIGLGKVLVVEVDKLLVDSLLVQLVSEDPVVQLALLYLPHGDLADQQEVAPGLYRCSVDSNWLVLGH